MRHVSRTHCVNLDWLFERISWDSNTRVTCVHTKHRFKRDVHSHVISGKG